VKHERVEPKDDLNTFSKPKTGLKSCFQLFSSSRKSTSIVRLSRSNRKAVRCYFVTPLSHRRGQGAIPPPNL